MKTEHAKGGAKTEIIDAIRKYQADKGRGALVDMEVDDILTDSKYGKKNLDKLLKKTSNPEVIKDFLKKSAAEVRFYINVKSVKVEAEALDDTIRERNVGAVDLTTSLFETFKTNRKDEYQKEKAEKKRLEKLADEENEKNRKGYDEQRAKDKENRAKVTALKVEGKKEEADKLELEYTLSKKFISNQEFAKQFGRQRELVRRIKLSDAIEPLESIYKRRVKFGILNPEEVRKGLKFAKDQLDEKEEIEKEYIADKLDGYKKVSKLFQSKSFNPDELEDALDDAGLKFQSAKFRRREGRIGDIDVGLNDFNFRTIRDVYKKGGKVEVIRRIDRHIKKVSQNLEKAEEIKKKNRDRLNKYEGVLVKKLEDEIKIRKEEKAKKKKSKPK